MPAGRWRSKASLMHANKAVCGSVLACDSITRLGASVYAFPRWSVGTRYVFEQALGNVAASYAVADGVRLQAGLYGPLPVCKTSYSHRSTTARLYSALDSGHLHDPSHDVIRCTGATLLRGSEKPCLLAAHPVSVRPMVHRSLCNRKVATSYCLPN